jgi:hypothetical protein
MVVEKRAGQKKSPIGGSKAEAWQKGDQRVGWRDPSLKTGQKQGLVYIMLIIRL